MKSGKSSGRKWAPIFTMSRPCEGDREGGQLAQRAAERVHLAPADAHHLDRRLVEVRQRRARRLLDHDRLEVAEERVLAGRADALVRKDSGDEDGLGVETAQDELEVGLEERREATLGDEPVLRAWLELGQDLV